MGSSSTSLTLGFAAGLPPETIEPFILSLRASGYRGRLGLVVALYGEEDLDRFRALADLVIVADSRYEAPPPQRLTRFLGLMRRTRGVRRVYPAAFTLAALAGRERESQARWGNLEFALEGLQSLRYWHYHNVLQTVARDAEQVFLTDLRDVIFQRDPFDPPVATLEVFLEDLSVTVGSEPFNRRWLEALYGPEAVANIGNLPVSCSGTVIGNRDEILRYLTEMWSEIGWRRRPLGSHDQGVHNYLLRAGRLGHPEIVENGHGRVLTMGKMSRVEEHPAGTVLNDDGTVPAVLHQYDRDPARARRLRAALVDN